MLATVRLLPATGLLTIGFLIPATSHPIRAVPIAFAQVQPDRRPDLTKALETVPHHRPGHLMYRRLPQYTVPRHSHLIERTLQEAPRAVPSGGAAESGDLAATAAGTEQHSAISAGPQTDDRFPTGFFVVCLATFLGIGLLLRPLIARVEAMTTPYDLSTIATPFTRRRR
ncbi:MAG: hypothetical protein JWN00_3922 [Actinomycetia bacterium]|jgi:hypothetical protein|nr:hypothetical protein [Actinomycetes bacterium]